MGEWGSIMTEDNPIVDDPGKYGIQDPEAPGEPNYWSHDVSEPVPGTAKQTRDEQEGLRGGHHETTEGSGHTTGRGGRGGHGGH
jgi:hypothetical protein